VCSSDLRWPKAKTFFEQVVDQMQQESLAPQVQLPLVDPHVVGDVLSLNRVLEDGAAALLPGNLRITDR